MIVLSKVTTVSLIGGFVFASLRGPLVVVVIMIDGSISHNNNNIIVLVSSTSIVDRYKVPFLNRNRNYSVWTIYKWSVKLETKGV